MTKTCCYILLLLLLCAFHSSYGRHVKGGHLEYTYNGPGTSPNSSNYTFTVTVFFSCTTTGPKDNVYLGVFDATTRAIVLNRQITFTTTNSVVKKAVNPCMSNPPAICYQIYTYVFNTDLADNPAGYIVTVQDALRIDGIMNIIGSGSAGITINCNVPGTIAGLDYHTNNSPHFLFRDTAIVCYQGNFSYQFAATDPDNDSLSYSFGDGLTVANANANTSTTPPAAPPYPALTYSPGFSGAAPLGPNVTINPVTGLISGTAPTYTGEYVVAVYVKEWRKGVLISVLKKELQIYVYNCSLTAAALNNSYINCDNFTFNFQNESGSSVVTSYAWDFGVPNNSTDTSSQPTPVFTYPDTGLYQLKLKVSTSAGCTDSATAPVKVFPGFTPDFSVTGSCYQSPVVFKNTSYVAYGTASLLWNFGDLTTEADTASQANTTYLYPAPMQAAVSLVVQSSKGCIDTLVKNIAVTGRPDILLPFKDTLICSVDSLPLLVSSSNAGSISWSPGYNIINPNTANPIVFPKDTTVYTVVVRDKGCVDSASIKVNVVDFVTVSLPADTTICKTDSIRLRPNTYGLSFQWTPAASLSNSLVKNPLAAPLQNTVYTVTANLGKCQARASQTVKIVPYPTAYAGADTTLCFGASAVLHGIVSGPIFSWSPAAGLSSISILQPSVSPLFTTAYILTDRDTLGCPKPFRDTVVINVLPPLMLNAGHDTAIVTGQPLQLFAKTSNTDYLLYSWIPATWLNNSSIANPVATISSPATDSITYTVTATNSNGCFVSDEIKIFIYKTLPGIYMPNAFSPNADGKNDVMKPILAGISSLDYFSIYNRWGQLIFSTSQMGRGWDGNIGGKPAATGSFVYIVRAKDYLGKTLMQKGSFVLVK